MKKICTWILSLMALLALCACGRHEHTWVAADCIQPKTCAVCGETEGDALGHEWQDATCTQPKTCSRCGQTEGEALGHTIREWSVTKEATCTTLGTEAGTCTVCGMTVERQIEKAAHTPGDWEISQKPTANTDGVRVIRCQICGEELQRETFQMTPEELKQEYISQCTTIAYDKLARTPDTYKGQKVKMTGYVVQVCSEASSAAYYSTYRVATAGRYDNVVYLRVNNYGSGSRILEDDRITFYGEYDGLYSYETVLHSTLTIPQVTAEYVD